MIEEEKGMEIAKEYGKWGRIEEVIEKGREIFERNKKRGGVER